MDQLLSMTHQSEVFGAELYLLQALEIIQLSLTSDTGGAPGNVGFGAERPPLTAHADLQIFIEQVRFAARPRENIRCQCFHGRLTPWRPHARVL